MKRILKQTIPIFAALLLAVAFCFASDTKTFKDVPKTHWAFESIEKAAADGVMCGTGDGLFSPEGALTVAQFLTVMVRSTYPEELSAAGQGGKWYEPVMAIADSHDLYRYSPGLKARPNSPILRNEMAGIIAALCDETGLSVPYQAFLQTVKTQIPDIKQNPYRLQTSIAVVYSLGIIGGVDEAGTFSGNTGVTRAQAAVIYARYAACKEQQTMAEKVIDLVNEERKAAGLSLLRENSALNEVAMARAIESTTSFSHQRPNGEQWKTVYSEAGITCRCAGENLARKQKTPEKVMSDWMGSDSHRSNILNRDVTEIGTAVVKAENTYHWVQVFADGVQLSENATFSIT